MDLSFKITVRSNDKLLLYDIVKMLNFIVKILKLKLIIFSKSNKYIKFIFFISKIFKPLIIIGIWIKYIGIYLLHENLILYF